MPCGPFSFDIPPGTPLRRVLRTPFHPNLSLPTGPLWAHSPLGDDAAPLERSWFNGCPHLQPSIPGHWNGTQRGGSVRVFIQWQMGGRPCWQNNLGDSERQSTQDVHAPAAARTHLAGLYLPEETWQTCFPPSASSGRANLLGGSWKPLGSCLLTQHIVKSSLSFNIRTNEGAESNSQLCQKDTSEI